MIIRPFSDEDLDDCLSVYRENRIKDLIPDHYESMFISDLSDPEVLSLIGIDDGQIVACGSINYLSNYQSASLSFGLVRPNMQRRGYGSKMLVARISLLEEAKDWGCDVYLSATKNSVRFYNKVVGFGELSRDEDEYGNEFFNLYLPLDTELIESSIEWIRDSDVELDYGIEVPIKHYPQTE